MERARSSSTKEGRADHGAHPAAAGLTCRGAAPGVLLLALVTVLGWATAGPASAHATLVATSPRADDVLADAPGVVELRFTEPVAAPAASVRVLGPDGRRVERPPIRRTEDGRTVAVGVVDAGKGSYTVTYRVESADSHTIGGALVFHVGRPTAAADPRDGGVPAEVRVVAWAGRWSAFVGTLLGVGGTLFALVAGAPASGLRRLRGLIVAGGGALVLGTLAATVARIAELYGRPLSAAVGLLPQIVLDTRAGVLEVVRLLGGLGLVAAGGLVLRRRWLPLLATPVPVLVPALAGHAWTTSPAALAVVVDAIHLAGVAGWLGGLTCLLATAPPAADWAAVVRRFSRFALPLVAVIVVTGTVSAWLQVRSLGGITDSRYGSILMVKLALVVGLLALAALARFRFLPRATDQGRLLGIMVTELVVGLAVVGVTASLIGAVPPRARPPAFFTATVELPAAGGSLAVAVIPATAGLNQVHLTFSGAPGGSGPVDAVEVSVAAEGVPARRLAASPLAPDHFVVDALALSPPGRWTIDVTAVRRGDPRTATFTVPVR